MVLGRLCGKYYFSTDFPWLCNYFHYDSSQLSFNFNLEPWALTHQLWAISHELSSHGPPPQILHTYLLTGAIFPVGSENLHHESIDFNLQNHTHRTLLIPKQTWWSRKKSDFNFCEFCAFLRLYQTCKPDSAIRRSTSALDIYKRKITWQNVTICYNL